MTEQWYIADDRTGKRVSVATFFSREQAESQIAEWRDRHFRGGRPDITWDKLEHLVAKERGDDDDQ